jgi:hypothetical protein
MSHRFTREQIEFIKVNVVGKSYSEIISFVKNQFGIQLNKIQVKSFMGNHKLNSGRTGRFESGHIPANKGTHINTGGKETQFKRGHKPWNYKPVGTERVNADGYVDIKIADPKKWKTKHILIWEAENAPVPKGHVVIFGDGNRFNFELDNLILISRKELAVLNKNRLIQGDADLTRSVILIADIYLKCGEGKRTLKGKQRKKAVMYRKAE